MSRGDQRDRDRAKAQAKQAAKLKAQGKGGDPLQRNASDAAALAAKVAAKKAKAEESASNGGSGSGGPAVVPRKKVGKPSENLDDLLLAGLDSGKKRAK